MNRRRQEIVRLDSGRLIDRALEREWLAGMVKPRPTVERLSESDPAIVAFEATARGARAA